MAAWSWGGGDRVARRLAAVQLVNSKAAQQRQVAAVFGVDEDTLVIWRAGYNTHGVAGLAEKRQGPKGPSKLTDTLRVEIARLRAERLSLRDVAAAVGCRRSRFAGHWKHSHRRPMRNERARRVVGWWCLLVQWNAATNVGRLGRG